MVTFFVMIQLKSSIALLFHIEFNFVIVGSYLRVGLEWYFRSNMI